jgi:drug/metabolite transporter (DMT)-like permease
LLQDRSAAIVALFVISETAPCCAAALLIRLYASATSALAPRCIACNLMPIRLLKSSIRLTVPLLNYKLRQSRNAAALIFATFPLLTVVVATILGEERPTAAKTVGVLLTIVGVALAIGERVGGPGHATGEWLGELAILSSALAGAICSVLYRPYLRKYPALPVSAIAMLASVGFLALLAAGEGFFNALPQFTRGGWLAVLFIGVSSGVGYYLWLWALGRTTPTRVTVFLGLSPITATALGASFLGEPVSLMLAGGLACVVLGLWIAHREPTTGLG